MKISELIEKLQLFKEQYGDIETLIEYHSYDFDTMVANPRLQYFELDNCIIIR